jgi:hypothetical protein
MSIDISMLDRHLLFVQREEHSLRSRNETWAKNKADNFKELAEFLRRIRQEHQMTGMNGKRIDG